MKECLGNIVTGYINDGEEVTIHTWFHVVANEIQMNENNGPTRHYKNDALYKRIRNLYIDVRTEICRLPIKQTKKEKKLYHEFLNYFNTELYSILINHPNTRLMMLLHGNACTH